LSIKHIPSNQNQEANRLAQSGSGYQQIIEILADEIVVDGDWRKDIIEYLNNQSQQVSSKCLQTYFVATLSYDNYYINLQNYSNSLLNGLL